MEQKLKGGFHLTFVYSFQGTPTTPMGRPHMGPDQQQQWGRPMMGPEGNEFHKKFTVFWFMGTLFTIYFCLCFVLI